MMFRIAWIALVAVPLLSAPAFAQLDSGTGQQASRAVNTPLPHHTKAKPRCARHAGAKQVSGCAKPHR